MSQSFVQIPNDLFKINLSSLQFRALCNFIRISRYNNGHSFFGYEKLAKMNGCQKAAMIKTVKSLEELRFIQLIERANYSKSNDILLTLDAGISYCKNGGFCTEEEGYLKDTPTQNEGYLKDTPQPEKGYLKDTPNPKQGYLKDTEGYLKDTEGYLKDTPIYNKSNLNNLNLNNLKNTRAGAEVYLLNTPDEKATGDAAPVRSMPDAGLPAEARQRELEASFDMIDLNNVLCCRENLGKEIENYQFLKLKGGMTACRPYGQIFASAAAEDKIVDFWARKLGTKIAVLAYDTRYLGEIKIEA